MENAIAIGNQKSEQKNQHQKGKQSSQAKDPVLKDVRH